MQLPALRGMKLLMKQSFLRLTEVRCVSRELQCSEPSALLPHQSKSSPYSLIWNWREFVYVPDGNSSRLITSRDKIRPLSTP